MLTLGCTFPQATVLHIKSQAKWQAERVDAAAILDWFWFTHWAIQAFVSLHMFVSASHDVLLATRWNPITTASKTSNIFWEHEKEPEALAWPPDSNLIRHLWDWKEHISPTFRHTRAGPLPESSLMFGCRYDGRIYSNLDWLSRIKSISKTWF